MSNNLTIMTAKEVAEFLGINKETVYRLARNDELPCFHLGSAVRFSKTQIEAWVNNELTTTKNVMED